MKKTHHINKAITNDKLFLSSLDKGLYTVDAERGLIKSHIGAKKSVGTYKHLSGYFVLHLPTRITNGVDRFIRVHRAVWISKYGIPPKGSVIGHKNNIKTDCKIENLYLTTIKGNLKDAKRDGLLPIGEKIGNSVLTEQLIKNIKLIYKKGDRTFGICALARKYNVHRNTINDIFSKRTWAHIK
jgi:hypothetical protein